MSCDCAAGCCESGVWAAGCCWVCCWESWVVAGAWVDCATANVAHNSAMVAITTRYFMVLLPCQERRPAEARRHRQSVRVLAPIIPVFPNHSVSLDSPRNRLEAREKSTFCTIRLYDPNLPQQARLPINSINPITMHKVALLDLKHPISPLLRQKWAVFRPSCPFVSSWFLSSVFPITRLPDPSLARPGRGKEG